MRLWLCVFLGMIYGGPVNAGIPSAYDEAICEASARWLPVWRPDDCLWLKAQVYQESRMKPNAVSPAGAQGLLQIMPGTWRDNVRTVSRAVGVNFASPFDPRASLHVGAYYMMKSRNAWITERPEWARRQLAWASYNAGLGNILRAQARCAGALLWDDVAPCLKSVTGRHSAETIGYVRQIERWAAQIRSGL